MPSCCPPGHGCNAPGGGECCALALCETAAAKERTAAIALERWQAWQQSKRRRHSNTERRFLRRAFQRSRDQALITLALRTDPGRAGRGRRR